MQQYVDLVEKVLRFGNMTQTRNGGRLTIWGHQMRFNLLDGFPAVTTKRLAFRSVAGELCWFLNGQTTLEQLHGWDIHIWDLNAGDDGDLGPIYGYQWRNYGGSGHDQIAAAIDLLRTAPASTRNMVMAWHPVDSAKMKLPPCHFSFQLHSDGKNLALQATMRSSDIAIGWPFNVASYALLCHLFGHVTGLRPVELIMDLGNAHIYEEHIDLLERQIQREPLPLPQLVINGDVSPDLRGLHPDQFKLQGYVNHGPLLYQMKV